MFTEEQFAKFEEVRDFLAHKNFKAKRTQKMSDVFETMFDEILKQKKVNQTAKEAGLSLKTDPNGFNIESSTVSSTNGSLDIFSNSSIDISSHGSRDMGSNRVGQRSKGQCGRGVLTKNEIEVQLETFPQAQRPAEAEFDAVTESPQHENENIETKNAEAAVKCGTATTWNSLTPKRKKMILELDKCCQYEDFETGKVCGSTFNLEIDHITPKHQGGTNDPLNLRVLCRAHNQFRNRVV